MAPRSHAGRAYHLVGAPRDVGPRVDGMYVRSSKLTHAMTTGRPRDSSSISPYRHPSETRRTASFVVYTLDRQDNKWYQNKCLLRNEDNTAKMIAPLSGTYSPAVCVGGAKMLVT